MNINLSLIAEGIVFAIFIWFSAKMIWPPLMVAIEQRQKTIADGLAAAERGSKALEDASAKSDEALKAARVQAQEILASASKQASQIVEAAKSQAQTEADRIKQSARGEVERETSKAREELRQKVGELAVAGASKILKREIDAKAHADVLKDLAARV
ncbi:MAG TPA: F0F1 ATP synthase subunit B [Nevskiaceae bacterium]|nr:F0F1 ATP synthase subunit B [Nevskiaceae bacterium]